MPLITPEDLRNLPAEAIAHLAPLLRALWHDAQGDWAAAHDTAAELTTPEAAWLHAYLHREEGDSANSAYWYRRAGKPVATGPLEAEWHALAFALLQK